jgi:hypothetical protein
VLTLLVACFAMILMSLELALPGTSLISWQYLLHEDHSAVFISFL